MMMKSMNVCSGNFFLFFFSNFMPGFSQSTERTGRDHLAELVHNSIGWEKRRSREIGTELFEMVQRRIDQLLQGDSNVSDQPENDFVESM